MGRGVARVLSSGIREVRSGAPTPLANRPAGTTSAALNAALEAWVAAQSLLATVLISATIVLVVYNVVAIVVTATLIGRDARPIQGGLGAASAVQELVFRDTLLSVVAGIQRTGNDLIRVGDSIEMPQYDADGDVVDIARNTVEVQNRNRTSTVTPTHRFLNHRFKHWRGMQVSGGRRLTNVGTFRASVTGYLRSRPDLRDDVTLHVRQLDPTREGFPIQRYVFVADSRWDVSDGVRAAVFDHLLAIVSEFGLRVLRQPTGTDVRRLALAAD